MPSSPLLLDDRSLVALLVGEPLPVGWGAERFTTASFHYRACRVVVLGAGGYLSGPFEQLDPDHRATALEQMMVLPDDVGLPDPRHLVPVMVDVHRRHPTLNVLNTEAVAAALLLGATLMLSGPNTRGQLKAVLPAEGIPIRPVDLP